MIVAPNEPLVRILCDTNVFVSTIVLQSELLTQYLDDLIDQHENGLMELVVPKAVQAELYGLLRSGRIQSRRQPVILSHQQIMYVLEPYLDVLFDRDYLTGLGALDWPHGKAYKELLGRLLAEEYGWHDWGQAYIEKNLRHPIELLGLTDRHDLPIMAAGLYHGVDLIITSNMADFIDPLGKIRVMSPSDAKKFDHFTLHAPYDIWEEAE